MSLLFADILGGGGGLDRSNLITELLVQSLMS